MVGVVGQARGVVVLVARSFVVARREGGFVLGRGGGRRGRRSRGRRGFARA